MLERLLFSSQRLVLPQLSQVQLRFRARTYIAATRRWAPSNRALGIGTLRCIRSFSDQQQRERERERQPKRNAGRLGAAAAAASVLLGKTKYVLAGLKLTKMTPLVSMVLTSATYSLFFGLHYSIGMVGLIFVHETGHAIAMRQYGVPFAPMVFVPFMGAVIAMKDLPRNVREEA